MKSLLTRGAQIADSERFNEYRDAIIEDFDSRKLLYRRKLSQGAFWTILDKDLANQYFRDERWFFGFKYKDDVKLIDHGTEKPYVNSSIGFISKPK